MSVDMTEYQEYQKGIYNILLERIKKAYPDADPDTMHTTYRDAELTIYPDNMHYYRAEIRKGYAHKHMTDLAVHIEMLKERSKLYLLLEHGNEVTLVTTIIGEARVMHFDKRTGRKRKHRRNFLTINESGKGQYIVLNRKRVYIDFEGVQE